MPQGGCCRRKCGCLMPPSKQSCVSADHPQPLHLWRERRRMGANDAGIRYRDLLTPAD